MVLLYEGAIPCECHVIDDTPRFLTIVILNISICDCSIAASFLTLFLSPLCTSTHTAFSSGIQDGGGALSTGIQDGGGAFSSQET